MAATTERNSGNPKSADIFHTKPTFKRVYGLLPTPDAVYSANISLFEAMYLAAEVQRGWKGGTTGVVYTSSPVSAEVASLRDNQLLIQQAKLAVAHLFPDGPVNGFPVRSPKRAEEVTYKGDQLNEIVDAFVRGDRRPIRKAFSNITCLLSTYTGVDLTPLDQYFLAYTPGELTVLTNPQAVALPRDLSRFINTQGTIFPPNKPRRAARRK